MFLATGRTFKELFECSLSSQIVGDIKRILTCVDECQSDLSIDGAKEGEYDARLQDGHSLQIPRNYGSHASYTVTKQPFRLQEKKAPSKIKYSAPTPTLEGHSWLDKTCQRISHVPELSLHASGIYSCSMGKAVVSMYWSWAVHFYRGNGGAKSLERCM